MSHVESVRLNLDVLSWAYTGPAVQFRVEASDVGATWTSLVLVTADRTNLVTYSPSLNRYMTTVASWSLYRVAPEGVDWVGTPAYARTPGAPQPTCILLGTVYGPDGQPAPGVLVEAVLAVPGSHPGPSVTKLASAISGDDGTWSLPLPRQAMVSLRTDGGLWSFLVPDRDAATLDDVAPGVGLMNLYPGRTGHGIFSGHSRRF